MERIAECHCGQFKAIASGEPESVYVCHCKACQRRTGAVVHFGSRWLKAKCGSKASTRFTTAWPTAASRSAFISARTAAAMCSGKAIATRRLAASRSAASMTPISRRPPRPGRIDAPLAWPAAGHRAFPAIPLLRTQQSAPADNPYEIGLDKNAANFVPLTPIGFLARSAAVYPNRLAVSYGDAALYLARGARTLPPARGGAGGARRRPRRYRGADGAEHPRGIRGAFRRADGRRGVERAQHPARSRHHRLHPASWRGQGADHRHRILAGRRAGAGAARSRSRWSSTSPTRLGPGGERLGEMDYEAFLADRRPGLRRK